MRISVVAHGIPTELVTTLARKRVGALLLVSSVRVVVVLIVRVGAICLVLLLLLLLRLARRAPVVSGGRFLSTNSSCSSIPSMIRHRALVLRIGRIGIILFLSIDVISVCTLGELVMHDMMAVVRASGS